MTAEIERLFTELRTNTTLQEEARTLHTTADMVRFATSHGYDVTAEECEAYEAAQVELSDEELETVAGGWSLIVRSVLFN